MFIWLETSDSPQNSEHYVESKHQNSETKTYTFQLHV